MGLSEAKARARIRGVAEDTANRGSLCREFRCLRIRASVIGDRQLRIDNLLSVSTYYLATTALNGDGLQSTFSNEASKTIP